MLPLAGLTALASIVYGVSALRAPRASRTSALAATGIALAVAPILVVAVIVYAFATGGIE